MNTKPLTKTIFKQALKDLKSRDTDFNRVLTRFGPPPMWTREPGFAALVRIILEQQVSLASARATFDRLLNAVSKLDPYQFLKLDDECLRAIGFSRQKTRYCQGLAHEIKKDRFYVDGLAKLDDEQARAKLQSITGIGRWTADIYLLTALRRPDIWPVGDLALANAIQQIKHLKIRPHPEEQTRISLAWKPWRAVAARICWHYYLSKAAQKKA